jgi:hypothetical protein
LLRAERMSFRINVEGGDELAKKAVLDSVRIVPNFPKPGLEFKDLSHLLASPVAFQAVIDAFVDRYRTRGITGVTLTTAALATELRPRLAPVFLVASVRVWSTPSYDDPECRHHGRSRGQLTANALVLSPPRGESVKHV